jgi:signal transduction histidine kinase
MWTASTSFIMAASVPRPRRLAHVPEVTGENRDFRHSRFSLRAFYNLRMAANAPAPCEPFKPALDDPPELTAAASRGLDWFSVAAIGTWIACGLWPISAFISGQFVGLPAAVGLMAIALYGAALIAILTIPRRSSALSLAVPFTLALVESVTGILLNVDTAWYLGGTGAGIGLLVIVAAQLPYFLKGAPMWTWIVVQTVAMMGLAMRAPDRFALEGVVFTLAAIGFQVFAAASSMLAISEGRARTRLVRVNAELTATRELLAEGSRAAERLRISRDLHDTLGHHLTALSLQLDVASRMTDGKAAEHVQQAHAITKLLLSDVRDVVSSLRESSRLNLAESIRALAIQPLDAKVHLDLPETLIVENADRAETLLRAVQEVLTNTARHARARNLWIQLESTNGGIMLHTRDDGRGTSAVSLGNGLTGMRERFEEHGGRVNVHSGAGGGFEVRAFLPLPSSA